MNLETILDYTCPSERYSDHPKAALWGSLRIVKYTVILMMIEIVIFGIATLLSSVPVLFFIISGIGVIIGLLSLPFLGVAIYDFVLSTVGLVFYVAKEVGFKSSTLNVVEDALNVCAWFRKR